MKQLIIMSVMCFMTIAAAAQTYDNPRQSSNYKKLKVTKVERTADATIVYLKYTIPEGKTGWSRIAAYPSLTDEATGKKYQATDALNFEWGKKYTKTATYKIEFPPLPKNTSVVTFREAAAEKNPFVVSNIALPVGGQQKKTQSSPTKKKPAASSEFSKTYNTPKQRTTAKGSDLGGMTVTKVIRTNEYTVVHFRVNCFNAIFRLSNLKLIDDDTEKVYTATKALNFESGKKYSLDGTFKVQFPPLSRSASTLRFVHDVINSSGWTIILQLPM